VALKLQGNFVAKQALFDGSKEEKLSQNNPHEQK
jgi:hypothetical protein